MPQFINDDGDDCMPDLRGHKDDCKCRDCVKQRNRPKPKFTQQDLDCLIRVFGGGDDYDDQYDFDE